jgi:hypothetical protein
MQTCKRANVQTWNQKIKKSKIVLRSEFGEDECYWKDNGCGWRCFNKLASSLVDVRGAFRFSLLVGANLAENITFVITPRLSDGRTLAPKQCVWFVRLFMFHFC